MHVPTDCAMCRRAQPAPGQHSPPEREAGPGPLHLVTLLLFSISPLILHSLLCRMKIREAGCVLEEQPDKVAEATVLFLRGLGYNLKRNKIQSS